MSGEIPRAVLDAIYAHAREGYPEEVCGFIVGGLGPRPEAGAASEASLLEARRWPAPSAWPGRSRPARAPAS